MSVRASADTAVHARMCMYKWKAKCDGSRGTE